MLIDKTDGRDPKNREIYWMWTFKMLATDRLNIKDSVWPNTIYTTYHNIKSLLGQQYIRTWMQLGLHGIRTLIFRKRFYTFCIIFILCLCLILIYLCICYFILFTSCHIPLLLFSKCIWNHANIWDGASLWNSQHSLGIDYFYRELHLWCLH